MGRADTIVALSSGGLPAGVAVIRLSGAMVGMIVTAMAGAIPKPREATYRSLRARDGTLLDRGLVLFFPAPASFTGEDCAEFQIHGGRAGVSAVLREVCKFEACRLAEAGEFMLRAFLNGKADLLVAEATADLISAETEAQRLLAVENASGLHSVLYAEWRRQLIHARAVVEASLDFSEEEDVEDGIDQEAQRTIARLTHEIEQHLAGFKNVEIVRSGLDVVIVGAPNSGKSSLLNALARRDVAIVSDEPGTTRDLIEIALDLGGYKVRLTDSAGLRETDSKVEAIGIARAIKRASEADLVLLLDDGTGVFDLTHLLGNKGVVWVLASKADCRHDLPGTNLAVSSATGQGLDALLRQLTDHVVAATVGLNLSPWRTRQFNLLVSAMNELQQGLDRGIQAEVLAEHLRLASDAIGRISGTVNVEDLLDVIFSQFCVGK